MSKIRKSINHDLHYKLLEILEDTPDISQRELAKKLGISLGGANYCLKSLIEIGHIKINTFKGSANKSAYLYLLTPLGVSEKASLALSFLKRKIAEYAAIKKEIKSIQSRLKL